MTPKQPHTNSSSPQRSLVYIIGTYPILTTTFIDREIRILRQLGMKIQTLSLRRPNVKILVSDEHKALYNSTIYLLPPDYKQVLLALLYFALSQPLTFCKNFFYLFTRPHANFNKRLKTMAHFVEGVYAAYQLRDLAFDHIHAHFLDRASTVALIVGQLLKKPYSLTAHANDIYSDPVLVYEKIAHSKFTVTVSNYNKDYLLKHYPLLNAEKIYILHPWVDLSHFERSDSTHQAHNRLKIVSVGRLVEKKGHSYLIEACNLLQERGIDFECLIIGEGPLKASLQQAIDNYNLNKKVQLMGGQPQAEVLNQLQQSDLFALPCVVAQNGDRDGMPVAIAEAMAMEVPVVSTKLGGIGELVRPEAGILVPQRDTNALADALQTLATTDHAARVTMGKSARAIVAEDFEVNKGFKELATLFKK